MQLTTKGLLVWRKSDNFTAFTNGSQTWVNGPLGLQQRADNQRFRWEAAIWYSLAIVPPPTLDDRCHTAGSGRSRFKTSISARVISSAPSLSGIDSM